jgi:hypothetical protein
MEGFHLFRLQEEPDLIAYIVSNMQPGAPLKEMDPGPERERLKKLGAILKLEISG